MENFIRDFSAYRLDEVLQDWKPYAEIVHNALERTCKRNGLAFDPAVAEEIYNRVPTWGPNPRRARRARQDRERISAGCADQFDECPDPAEYRKAGRPPSPMC